MLQETSILLLLLFMALAIYDGLYLHIWKFELFNQKDSEIEHKIHTVRALLFPVIIYFLFVDKSKIGLYFGIAFFLTDLVVLALDAYFEKDSRAFMNGLPRWEYIIHLFANSLHFASFVIIIIIRQNPIHLDAVYTMGNSDSIDLIYLVGINVIPGAIIMGLIHLILTFKSVKTKWLSLKSKIICC